MADKKNNNKMFQIIISGMLCPLAKAQAYSFFVENASTNSIQTVWANIITISANKTYYPLEGRALSFTQITF